MDKLLLKLQELMLICQKNLFHAQKLQKQAYNKSLKPRSYTPSDKIWLNSKYIKTKQNRKLKAKFFVPFRVLPSVEKQVYKLELPKKWEIYDVFHMSLLEQDTIKKRQTDENVTRLEFEAGNSKKYELEVIQDSAVYTRELESGHLPELYYLVLWKSYSKEESIWGPSLAV